MQFASPYIIMVLQSAKFSTSTQFVGTNLFVFATEEMCKPRPTVLEEIEGRLT